MRASECQKGFYQSAKVNYQDNTLYARNLLINHTYVYMSNDNINGKVFSLFDDNLLQAHLV